MALHMGQGHRVLLPRNPTPTIPQGILLLPILQSRLVYTDLVRQLPSGITPHQTVQLKGPWWGGKCRRTLLRR